MKDVSNELKIVAEYLGHSAKIIGGRCFICEAPLRGYVVEYNPYHNHSDFKKLVEYLLMVEGCEFLTDDGLYFIYQYDGCYIGKRVLSHQEDMTDACISAIIELYNGGK